MTWKLKRLKQCAGCPWKQGSDPHTIPHGYSVERHRALANTIAEPGAINIGAPLHMFGCHEHPVGDEAHCVGWLMNQAGPGNNIAVRMMLLDCENVEKVVLDGPQHERFEDTLPKD